MCIIYYSVKEAYVFLLTRSFAGLLASFHELSLEDNKILKNFWLDLHHHLRYLDRLRRRFPRRIVRSFQQPRVS